MARRCGIAIYEAEMNLIIHTTNGGMIRVEIEPIRSRWRPSTTAPAFPMWSLARKAGYSTASEEVREMGFGAGMGLKNIERCVDEMNLESKVGEGTRLDMKIILAPRGKFPRNRSVIDRGRGPTMTLQDVIDQLDLTVLTQPSRFQPGEADQRLYLRFVELRDGRRQKWRVWVTLQAHLNIVAVAALLELSAVIITEGAQPEAATIDKANEEGITLLATDKPTFEWWEGLWEMGLRSGLAADAL